MSIIIKLLGLPLEATSVDVRLYFLGLRIPDRGVHIVGGDEGAVFIEFASDEDARQAMARGDGVIKNSNVKLLLSSRNEMQTVTEAARQRQQQYLQQQQQQLLQNQRPSQQQQQQLSAQNNNLRQYQTTTQLNHHHQNPPQQPSYLAPGMTPMGPALLPTTVQSQQQQHQSGQPVAASGGDPRMLSQNYQGIMNVMNQQQQTAITTSAAATTTTTVPTSQPPQLLQQHQQTGQQSAFVDPRILSQNYQGLLPGLGQLNPNFAATTTTSAGATAGVTQMTQPLLPQSQVFAAQQQFLSAAVPTTLATSNGAGGGGGGVGLNLGLLASMGGLVGQQSTVGGVPVSLPNNLVGAAMLTGLGVGNDGLAGLNSISGLASNVVGTNNAQQQQQQQNNNSSNGGANNSGGSSNRNHSPDSRARMSGMRGGDDKLFANKRCVLAASNIPYRTTSKEIIDFLSEFNIREDCIRRRYNQKGQPTADAKIAFPTPDAAMKALKTMNKKNLGGRPVFLKPV